MKKLRVAFCLRDMQMGGVESVLIRTLDKLLKYKNIEITVATYVNITTPGYIEYFKNNSQIKLCSLYPCKWLGTRLPHFFIWRIFIHFMRDLYRNIMRPLAIRKLKNIDVFIDYHDFGFHDEFMHIKHAKKIAWFHSSINVFFKRGFVKYLKYYDKLVVLTDDFKKDFVEKYPKYFAKLTRIYNPIDIEKIKEKSKESSGKITGDYFVCVSRLTPDKDIETVLRGFDLFWKENKKPNVKMVFVGDGNWAKYYQSIANGLDAKNQFVFTGVMSDPFVIMKNARANILSSYGEGLPTVLTESMVVETLNIASNCKYGPREILLGGNAGLLFEPGNVQQLAQCMGDIYNDNVDIKRMTTNATKSLNRFDADKIVKEIISLIS